jgi:AAA family ATP:ADP antiporter
MTANIERFDRNKSLLDRFLSLFTEVRAGEGINAIILAANVFYLLAFYSVLKIVRDALILSEAGAVAASYSAAGQAILLLFFVPAYSAFASRVNRVWLISGVTLFFASHLLIFYAIGSAGVKIGVPFYLWIGVFNMVAVAQFWAFANDIYSSERGRRLFPILGMGANLGAVVGSALTSVAFGNVGAYNLMLLAAFGLLVPVFLTIWINQRESGGKPRDRQAPEAQPGLTKSGGFALIFQQRYLMLIAGLVLLFNMVNTTGGFMLNTLIKEEAVARIAAGTANGLDERALIGTMAGSVQTSVNVLALILQAFVVSRLFKFAGVRGALFVLPFIALGGYAAVALLPMLATVRFTKILENSTDYSVQNTTRHALFLPTSRDAKYKAKQAIDSFFVRFGDMLQALVVFVGTSLAFAVRHYAILNVVLVGIWLVIAIAIAREHKKLSRDEQVEKAA